MTDEISMNGSPIEWEPGESSMVDRLSRVTATVPDRVAISDGGATYTYAELEAAANQIARAVLARTGPGPDTVGLMGANDAQLVVAVLGIVKAGKAYVLVDPSHPPEWTATMLAHAGCRLIVAAGGAGVDAVADRVGAIGAVDIADTVDESTAPPEVVIGAGTAFNVSYTSGSTGTPKGAVQTHGNMIDCLRFYADEYHIHPGDRFGVPLSVAFSPSASLVFSALLEGAAAVMFDVRAEGMAAMAQWMRRERITITYMVPTVLRRWMAGLGPGDQYPDLRLVMVGGEALFRSDADALFSHVPEHCLLRYGYGTSEAYMVTCGTVARGGPGEPMLATGIPVPGKQIAILGDDGQELADDEVGQIAVTSSLLSPGYWRDDEATRRVFLPDEGGERTYLTGDLGRIRDGVLEHIGRADSMVKIRGRSVVLADVETALLDLPQVTEAAVTLRPGPDGSPRLVGYVAPELVTAEELRRDLAQALPEYMIPSTFVLLERLPQLYFGKVDRQSLPAPDYESPAYVAPRGPTEKVIAGVVGGTLGLERVGVHDDLFDLGIDSLHVTEVAARMGKTLGVTLPPATLLAHPTTARLAEAIERGELASIQDSLVPVRPGGDRPPLFLVHGGGGGVFWLQPLARHLAPDQGLYGLQAEGFDGIPGPVRTVEELAARYLEAVRSVQSRGPYFLGGLSFGGKIAYEMAQLLVAAGETVEGLAIIDTELPLPGLGYRRSLRRRLGSFRAMTATGRAAKLYEAARLRLTAPLKGSLVRRRLRRREPLPDRFGLRTFYFNNMFAGRVYDAYEPRPYPGRIVVIGCEGTTDEHRTTWGNLSPECAVHEVATDHRGLEREPHVATVAEIIQAHMDEAPG